jgi:enamine deaminase RidA (YjgF/YER057c/UK114 family)
VPAGTDLAFVSGQIGNHADGRTIDPDATVQALQTFHNLDAIVHDLGATPRDIVKFTTLVVGTAGLAGFRAAREQVFPDWYPDGEFPTNTLMMVVALASPEVLVEIEAVVAVSA